MKHGQEKSPRWISSRHGITHILSLSLLVFIFIPSSHATILEGELDTMEVNQ